MAKIKVQVTENRTVNVEGKVYRAGDVFEYERGDTTAQLLSAGSVVEINARRKRSGAKTSGRKTIATSRRRAR